MNLQVINTNVAFDFPLQPTGNTPVSGMLVKQIDANTEFKIKVSYIVKPVQQQ